jgi:hypothetical protein
MALSQRRKGAGSSFGLYIGAGLPFPCAGKSIIAKICKAYAQLHFKHEALRA